MRPAPAARAGSTVAALLLTAAVGSPQNPPVLFDLTPLGEFAVARDPADAAGVLRSRLVRFRPERLDNLPPSAPAELVLNLFGDAPITAVLQERAIGELGFSTWFGEIRGMAGSVVILNWKGETLSGFVLGGRRRFRVRHVAGDLHAVDEMDRSRIPLEPVPVTVPAIVPSGESHRSAASAARVDVVMIYTPLVKEANGLTRVEADAAAAIGFMNRALTRSGVSGSIRLVGLAEATGYVEGQENGWFDAFAAGLRNTAGADLVSLLVQNYSYCGTANIGPNADAAFTSTIKFTCIIDTLAHEAGHNFGAHHAPEDPLPGGPPWKPYGYGYKDVHATPFPIATIMAYASCYTVAECYEAIPYYSNPNIVLNGRPVGAAMQDNARLLNEAFPIVERFRDEIATSPPSAPRNLTASVDGLRVTLTWDTPDAGPVSRYVLEAGRTPGSSDVYAGSIGLVTSLTASAPAGIYRVRVKAVNAIGAGPASNELTVAVGSVVEAPGAPQNLRATVSATTITLQWDAPLTGSVTGYRVEVGTATGLSDMYSAFAGQALSLSGEVPAGTYFIRVRALNSGGSGPASNEVQAIVPSGCTLPAAPALSGSRTGNVITLTWTIPTGGPITEYFVQAGSRAGASDFYEGSTSPQTTLSASAPAGTYFIKVSAAASCGRGPASNEIVLSIP